MCGRFVVSYTYKELLSFLEDDFDLVDVNTSTKLPNYNVAPSTNCLTVINSKKGLKAGDINWGYTVNNHFFPNVRSETVDTLFKSHISNNRCLFVASGYYEWDDFKAPHYFHKDTVLYFAGIYQKVENTFQATIITKQANDDIMLIHDRMPVILNEEQANLYLKSNDMFIIKELLQETTPVMTHEVSKRVNKVTNNTIDNIKPYTENRLF